MKFAASLVVLVMLFACTKEVRVYKSGDNLRLEGSWDVNTVVGTYYLNDTLWKNTVFTAPFTPDEPYRDYIHIDFTKDSVFFMYADSTGSKGKYTSDSTKIIVNYYDTLRYLVSDKGLRLERYSQYHDFGGNHKDTIQFSLDRR